MQKYILGLVEDYKLGFITLDRMWEIIDEELTAHKIKKLLKV